MGLLDNVSKGIKERPMFFIVHGPEGQGKTTFASEAPNPIILETEKGGSDFINTTRKTINSISELKEWLDALENEKHDYQTVVIDSIDHLEKMIFNHIVTTRKHPDKPEKQIKSIEDYGWGKGYTYALEMWQTHIVPSLNRLRENLGMHIVLIAHSLIKTQEDPVTNAAWDRYILKLHTKSAEYLKECSDAMFFFKDEVFISKDGQKTRAYGEGTKVCYTERRPSFDAKNRFDLPFSIPLVKGNMWIDIAMATKEEVLDLASVNAEIEKLIQQLQNDQIKEKATKDWQANKDNIEMAKKIMTRLKTLLSA